MVAVPPGLPKLQRWLAILLPIAEVFCGEEKIGEVEHVGLCGLRARCLRLPADVDLCCICEYDVCCISQDVIQLLCLWY